MVAVAVAVSFWDVRATAFVDGSRTVAHTALIHGAEAFFLVADAIVVRRQCSPTAPPKASSLSLAVAVSFWDVRASALVDGARSVADATLVELPTQSSTSSDAIGVLIGSAVTATYAHSRAGFRQSQSPSGMSDIRTRRWRRSVADATLVEFAHAVVHVVANAIGIGVRCAVTTAHAQGVELVSVAVAVTSGDVRTSALIDGARTVADAALVEFAHAVVDIVTDAIGIGVCRTVTATHAQSVELVAVAVAVSFDVRATVDGARTVADATSSSSPTQSSTSSQMPSASRPPRSHPTTPKASSAIAVAVSFWDVRASHS